MLVTEQEAMHRWCPHARQLSETSRGNYQTGFNRHDGNDIPSCIAASCMAWRFAEPKKLRDIDLVTSDVVENAPRLGYCGLSGSPKYRD